MKRLIRRTGLWLGATVCASTLQASPVQSIDRFETSQQNAVFGFAAGSDNSEIVAGEAVGSYRDVSVHKDAGSGSGVVTINNGVLAFDTGHAPTTMSVVYDGQDNDAATIDYDGLGTLYTGGFNLLAGNADHLLFGLLSSDMANAPLTVRVYDWDNAGADNFVEARLLLPQKSQYTSARDVQLGFADFTASAGVTGSVNDVLNSAGAIELMADNSTVPQWDLQLSFFGTGISSVPAPAGLALAALIGFGLMRRNVRR